MLFNCIAIVLYNGTCDKFIRKYICKDTRIREDRYAPILERFAANRKFEY